MNSPPYLHGKDVAPFPGAGTVVPELLDRKNRSRCTRRPEQFEPLAEITRWSLDDKAKEIIDAIVRGSITDPKDPEFMAPPEA